MFCAVSIASFCVYSLAVVQFYSKVQTMTDLFLNVDIVEDKNDQSPFSNIFDFLASHFISPARSAMAKEVNLISG